MDSSFERRPDGGIVCRFEPGEEQLAREFLARGPKQRAFEHPRMGDFTKATIGVSLLMLLLSPLFGRAHGQDLSESLEMGSVLATGSAICMALLGLLIRRELVVTPAKQRLKCGATFGFEELAVPRRTVRRVVAADSAELVPSEHVVVTTDDVAVSIGRNAASQADEIATKLNEVLFEYEEHRAVRAWLTQREHELGDPGPYRRGT